jgi:putative pyruvate formate lyase activating enzyme
VDPFEPAYLALDRSCELAERVSAGLRELEDCRACPRNCHVNPMADLSRVCHTGRYARFGSAFTHVGEEDCLSGWRGSGTMFFSLCNLRCVFCQNWDISQEAVGPVCPPEKLVDLERWAE